MAPVGVQFERGFKCTCQAGKRENVKKKGNPVRDRDHSKTSPRIRVIRSIIFDEGGSKNPIQSDPALTGAIFGVETLPAGVKKTRRAVREHGGNT